MCMHCNVELVYHSYLRLLHDTTDNTYMVGSSKDQNRGTITGQYHLNILSMLILVTKQSIKLGGSWDHPGYYFCRALCVSSRLCKCPSRVPWVLCHYQEVAVATQSWTAINNSVNCVVRWCAFARILDVYCTKVGMYRLQALSFCLAWQSSTLWKSGTILPDSCSLQNLAPCINQRPCVLWRKSENRKCTSFRNFLLGGKDLLKTIPWNRQ